MYTMAVKKLFIILAASLALVAQAAPVHYRERGNHEVDARHGHRHMPVIRAHRHYLPPANGEKRTMILDDSKEAGNKRADDDDGDDSSDGDDSGSGNSTSSSSDANLNTLFDGNKQFRANYSSDVLKDMASKKEAPPFMYMGCSDSRVNEANIFSAKPGQMFSYRSMANQFQHTDTAAESVLSYAVSSLNVKHILVMGHYGCDSVASAIASPPSHANSAVQGWISPIRELYALSARKEIKALRDANSSKQNVTKPEASDPGFRALVEENVKMGVMRIATSSVMLDKFAKLSNGTSSDDSDSSDSKDDGDDSDLQKRVTRVFREYMKKRADDDDSSDDSSDDSGSSSTTDVFVHGLVYDTATGEIFNLGVSVGPPGKAVPKIPFPAVKPSSSGDGGDDSGDDSDDGESKRSEDSGDEDSSEDEARDLQKRRTIRIP